ncbi:MAG: hypothetical protein ABJF89_12370 [Parasphingorhabdus sp.]|uniref:hypothetical protein n=1 Tax=Parasphingorhabdus sp. TaxID=2709688 RepID=UPI003264EB36
MNNTLFGSAALAASMVLTAPALAQDAAEPVTRADMITPEQSSGTQGAGPEPAPMQDLAEGPELPADGTEPVYTKASDGSICELHVWPTENYIGINMGLLSGFGVVGVLADQEVNKGKVATVKDLMEDYLGPRVQLEQLDQLEFTKLLKLEGYKVIVEDPSPSHDDAKKDPEIKAKAKAMNKTIKAKQRLTDSKAPCYAELFTTHIFYHKAMMYGSNLFTGWIFREFDGEKQTKVGKGQVKNPLENFPPKTEDMIAPAKLELRDAYSKNFPEYVEKKVFKVKRKKR